MRTRPVAAILPASSQMSTVHTCERPPLWTGRGADELPRAHSAHERRRVLEPDRRLTARDDVDRGARARERLDERAVHTAVHQAVRLQEVRPDRNLADDLILCGVREHQTEPVLESATVLVEHPDDVVHLLEVPWFPWKYRFGEEDLDAVRASFVALAPREMGKYNEELVKAGDAGRRGPHSPRDHCLRCRYRVRSSSARSSSSRCATPDANASGESMSRRIRANPSSTVSAT